MAAIRGDLHKGLGHKARDDVKFAGNLRTDLAISGETIRGALDRVVGPVEFKLTGCVLVIALNRIDSHLAAVIGDAERDWTEFLELIDVVAVGFGNPAVWFAIGAFFQPHHFGFGAKTKM